MLERDSAALGRGARRAGLLARRAAAGGRSPTRCGARRAGRARPQRAAGVRLARARRGARRRARASCCTCTTTGSSARSATCFTRGEDCTRCHGRNTLPGVRLNCRGGSRAEAAVYGAALALWQRRLAERGRRLRGAERVRARAAARARRAARRPGARRSPRSSARSRARSRGRGGALRAVAGPAGAGEGRRRRDRRVRARPACRWWWPATGRSASELRARPGADVRFTGRVTPRRAGASCAPAPRSPSCPRATRRSFRWPRSRRWRPGCRWSRPAPAGWRSRCPRTASTRPATSRAGRARRRAVRRRRGGRAGARTRARRDSRPPSSRRALRERVRLSGSCGTPRCRVVAAQVERLRRALDHAPVVDRRVRGDDDREVGAVEPLVEPDAAQALLGQLRHVRVVVDDLAAAAPAAAR